MSQPGILRILSLPLFGMLLAIYTGTAAAARQYQVEVIVFSPAHTVSEPPSIQAHNSFGSDSAVVRHTDLPASLYQLGPVKYTLQNSGDYTVLLHRAWRQAASSPSSKAAYPLQNGANRHSVSGNIRLQRGRYLHLDIDLALQQAGHVAYRMSEKRRIRTKELHYFDHPRFGVLVRVTPVTTSADATAPANSTSPQ